MNNDSVSFLSPTLLNYAKNESYITVAMRKHASMYVYMHVYICGFVLKVIDKTNGCASVKDQDEIKVIGSQVSVFAFIFLYYINLYVSLYINIKRN